ncbi:MAG: V-type ATP synthase subunit D, partial [Candidatus Thermoplasmatota archaeon]|nr:V-type ATP synthase subunit D [Candidatus Thermoplasmatota archaeon]
MALKDEVKPTRMELIELKRRIKLSEKGHKLLKMKRDGLIIEFFDLLEEAKEAMAQLADAHRHASRMMAIAQAVDGEIVVKSAALSVQNSPRIGLETKNIMGVVVPRIESEDVHTKLTERGYGLIGTSTRIDQAVDSFEDLVEAIIKAAEMETGLKKLLEEIEKTKRRVNALEFKVIPELKEARDFIAFRLDEMERETTFRLKKIKDKKQA